MYSSDLFYAASILAAGFASTATAQGTTGRVTSNFGGENEGAPANYLFPPSRGSLREVAQIGPCQGFEVGQRLEYPLNGGTISWATTRDIGDARFLVSAESDPDSQDQFQDALTNITGGWVGQQCIDAPNFELLGFQVGQDATIQLRYTAGSGNMDFYACTDVTFVDTETFEANSFDTQCTNRVDSLQIRNNLAANPQYAAIAEELEEEESDSGSNGLSLAEAGVIGAMTTLGVFILLALFSWWAGVIAFGRNQNVQQQPVVEKRVSTSSV